MSFWRLLMKIDVVEFAFAALLTVELPVWGSTRLQKRLKNGNIWE